MKIGLVNDSALALEAIRRALASSSRHQVMWVAEDGAEAVNRCANAPPDLVLMDMYMPRMDGVEATRRIMRDNPVPILIVTGSVTANSALVFEALGAGALDAIATPRIGTPEDEVNLLRRIDLLERLSSDRPHLPPSIPLAVTEEASSVVVIGCSAGGPAALCEVLGGLDSGMPAGVVIVQHVDARFTQALADWLNARSRIPVRAAEDGDQVLPGTALIAGKARHLIFTRGGRLIYSDRPEHTIYRPSVDALFESALSGWTKPIMGVLLTGMGRDGAVGLKALRDAGHFTIAQDEATSALYGMPKAAAELDAAAEILPLPAIAGRIMDRMTPHR